MTKKTENTTDAVSAGKMVGGQVKPKTEKAVKESKVPAAPKVKAAAPAVKPSGKYFEGLGRRKTAIARVRYYPAASKLSSKGAIIVNGKDAEVYFPQARYRMSLWAPLKTLKVDEGYIEVRVVGGGIMSQAEAILLGIARALVKYSEGYKKTLRASGHLTRDSRKVERKKYGLRKARRAHQWKKR